MIFLDFLFVLIIALLLTGIFAAGFRRNRTLPALFTFFIVLFLSTWAAGAWIEPVGPVIWGIAWVPFFAIGLIFAFLLAALLPPAPPPRTVIEREEQVEEAGAAGFFIALNIFFWILIVGLLAALLVRYLT
jgi:hypothetical protein